MIENIAILVGVFAVIACTMGCIVFLLLKKNIKDILQKDSLVFDKNFEIKKNAITESFNIIDEVLVNGKSANMSNAFIERAIKCYNDLLCVVSNKYIIDEFYNIALNANYVVNHSVITSYKMACRTDIGFKNKNSSIKKVKTTQDYQPVNQTVYQPTEAYIPQQEIYTPQPEVQQPQPRPAQPRTAQPRPTQSARPAVRPAQPRPAQPRPTNPDEKK